MPPPKKRQFAPEKTSSRPNSFPSPKHGKARKPTSKQATKAKQAIDRVTMGMSDGSVNWPLFFGCILIAFGPIASLFFVVVAKRAQLVILALSGAFTWLVAILICATLWRIIPPLKDSIEATIPVSVVIQEGFRYVFYVLYTRTERAVLKVTTSSHQFPLNDITSSLAGGVGFSLMHSLMMYGSLVGSSTGTRGAAFSSSCESVPLIFSAAMSTLALTVMDVALMVVAFDGYRKKSFLAIGAVFVIHMAVALSALANQKTNGCTVSIPLHFAGAVVASGAAALMISRRNAGAAN